jgi:hypothetical protein
MIALMVRAILRVAGEETMQRFILGVIVGLFLGAAASAYAAGIYGSGTLLGWSVVKDGEEVCSDPEVDTAAKEIECD